MQLTCFIFSLTIGEMLWWYTKCQKINVWRTVGQVKTKLLFAQTILDKVFGTEWGNPVKLDGTREVWYLLLRVSWLLLPNVSTQIWDFPNISLFSRILSLKSFGNSWGNSYTKFAVLDITFIVLLVVNRMSTKTL